MVGAAVQDHKSPVDLLQNEDASEEMCKRQVREFPAYIRA